MDNKIRRELVDIALKALRAIADMTPMPRREHDMWMLAINRVRQTEIDVRADEELAASRQPIPIPKAPRAERDTNEVEMLIDKGWTLDDARSFLGEREPREGGGDR
jgi:hypothetical protein